MIVSDYEKCCISTILRFPSGPELIPEKMCIELSEDKFSSIAHKFIWKAISNIVVQGEVPNTTNVIYSLGNHLESAGGETYIRSLYEYLPKMGVNDSSSWHIYANVVKRAGDLRQLGLVIDKWSNYYKDFEKLVNETENITEFMSNFMSEVQGNLNDIKYGYKHISEAVEIEKQNVDDIISGEKSDLIYMGWPSLMSFGIPYSPSFGVIIGLRGMGKSQLAYQMVLGKAEELKITGKEGICSINSLEMKDYLIVRRLACSRAAIDSRKLRLGSITEEEKERYFESLGFIAGLPIEYNDCPDITTEELTLHAIAQNVRKKRVMAIHDYTELFNDKNQNEEQRISNITRNLRKLCWYAGSCEIIISQVNNSALMTSTKIAGIDRSRYSGAISHAVDWGIEVYNPYQMAKSNINFKVPGHMNEESTYLLIEKNRNGRVGEFEIGWKDTTTTFWDIKNPVGIIYNFNDKKQQEDCDY